MSQRVGYQRVSTIDQNTDRQLNGVELDKMFTDKASGKDTQRPQLAACLEYVREGYTLALAFEDHRTLELCDCSEHREQQCVHR